MKKLYLTIAAIGLTSCGTESITPNLNNAIIPENITVQSASDFDTSDKHLQEAIAKRDLKLFIVVNHGEGAKSVGKPVGQSKLYIFGNPKSGTPLMQDDITFGLELPMKILIYQNEEGNVMLARKDITLVTSHYNITEKDDLLGKVSNTLDVIMSEAAK